MRSRIARFWEVNGRFTLFFLIGISCLFLIAASLLYSLGIRINVTRSFPLGFYLLEKGEPSRGDLVFLKNPENAVVEWGRQSGAVPRARMFKKIYGLEGDEVEVSKEGIRINGKLIERSRIIDEMADGSLIPSIAQSGIIPLGSVWVMSEYSELSFDSRYFGAVPRENIQARAKPLWIW